MAQTPSPATPGSSPKLALSDRQSPANGLGSALWAVAAPSALYYVLQAARGNVFGLDLFPVWTATRDFLAHRPPYVAVTHAGAFLYPPSSLLLLAPLGLLPFPFAKLVFLFLEAAAVGVAGIVSLRLAGRDWRGLWGAGALLGMTLFGPLLYAIEISNVAILVVPAYALALLAASRGHWSAAGVLFGLGLAVKPILAPLLLVFLLWRQWRATILALAVPLGLSAVALPLIPSIGLLVRYVIPYVVGGQSADVQHWNVSVFGAVAHLGGPRWLAAIGGIVIVLASAYVVLTLMKDTARCDAIRIVEVTGVLVLGTLAAFPFTLSYYDVLLIPFLISAVHPQSVLHTPAAWFGIFLFGTSLPLHFAHVPSALGAALSVHETVGYFVLLAAIGVVGWRRAASAPRPP